MHLPFTRSAWSKRIAAAAIVREDGTITFADLADTNSGRGDALLNLLEDLDENQNLLLGPGVSDIGDNALVLPPGTRLLGAGGRSTTISSTLGNPLAAAGPGIIQVGGDDVEIADLKIQAADTNKYQFPIAGRHSDAGQIGFRNLLVRNCHVAGGTDGLFIQGAAGEIFSGRFENTVFRTLWDAIACFHLHDESPMASVDFDLLNCDIATTGGSPKAAGGSQCMSIQMGDWRLWNCTLSSTCDVDNAVINAVLLSSADRGELPSLPTSTIRMFGGRITVSGANPTYLYALNNSDAAASSIIYVSPETDYDRTKENVQVASSGGIQTLNNSTTFAAYAAGTAYQLTATSALVAFGTTSPAITITRAGTYRIRARARLDYTGATFAAVRTASLKLRRTNNTAADLANSAASAKTAIVTTQTGTMAVVPLPEVFYSTNNSNDTIRLFASIDVLPSAGSLDIVEAEIVAERIY